MKIESVLCTTITNIDLRKAEDIKAYLEKLEIPKNIFSKEYREARELELELIRYVQILELLEKYKEDIECQQIEMYYFRDSVETVIIANIDFKKKKSRKKEFEKELKEIKSKNKRKLKKWKKDN